MFKIGTIIVSVTRKRIAIRESCERESFAVRGSGDPNYFSASSRAGILDAIAGPGEATSDGARWKGTVGTVVITKDNLTTYK